MDAKEKETKKLYEKLSILGYSIEECKNLAELTLKIKDLKEKKDAIILAHHYQIPEIIFGVADFVGDSYGLSLEATKVKSKTIVFCGVKFMAETAKILNPEKKVLLPSLEAGCSLAESITPKDIKELKKKHKNSKIVCYVNTSAEVKAECDACCTSSNALKVIEAMPSQKVIFVPDNFMTQNLQKLTKKTIITWKGKCIVHETFTREQIIHYKNTYQNIKVLAHTECLPNVIELSDLAGGTNDMINYIEKSNAQEFLLITECGMADELKVKFPEKKIMTPCSICPYMKKITLENLLNCLEKNEHEITLSKKTIEKAQKSLTKMLEIGK
ncbi:MAG: quinolinate synthase NadA [Candidatus Diapherotrites archaeon]